MISKSTPKILEMPRATAVVSAMQHVGTSMWPLIALVSLAAGIGSGWRVLFLRSDLLTPRASFSTDSDGHDGYRDLCGLVRLGIFHSLLR
jgi:hypothetical protein